MSALPGRERLILCRLASVLLEDPSLPTERLLAAVNRSLEGASNFMRLLMRVSLLAFDWGAWFLATGDGRFELFSRMPWRAQRRYVRLWMRHKRALFRQIFQFLKLMIIAPYYDDRVRAARVGFDPKWP
ncbi:MAG: hypothetical protein HYY16_06945 [Planctomycetes bacterium]|nr:hypothetical protein [Planctomycetota bacterium]